MCMVTMWDFLGGFDINIYRYPDDGAAFAPRGPVDFLNGFPEWEFEANAIQEY